MHDLNRNARYNINFILGMEEIGNGEPFDPPTDRRSSPAYEYGRQFAIEYGIYSIKDDAFEESYKQFVLEHGLDVLKRRIVKDRAPMKPDHFLLKVVEDHFFPKREEISFTDLAEKNGEPQKNNTKSC